MSACISTHLLLVQLAGHAQLCCQAGAVVGREEGEVEGGDGGSAEGGGVLGKIEPVADPVFDTVVLRECGSKPLVNLGQGAQNDLQNSGPGPQLP
jgi:hypothetical protein